MLGLPIAVSFDRELVAGAAVRSRRGGMESTPSVPRTQRSAPLLAASCAQSRDGHGVWEAVPRCEAADECRIAPDTGIPTSATKTKNLIASSAAS